MHMRGATANAHLGYKGDYTFLNRRFLNNRIKFSRTRPQPSRSMQLFFSMWAVLLAVHNVHNGYNIREDTALEHHLDCSCHWTSYAARCRLPLGGEQFSCTGGGNSIIMPATAEESKSNTSVHFSGPCLCEDGLGSAGRLPYRQEFLKRYKDGQSDVRRSSGGTS